MQRRAFLQQAGTTSVGALIARAVINEAKAQAPVSAPGGNYQPVTVEVSGNQLFFRRYGNGPAILMIHGFPRTSLMWRDLAPQFAVDHTVICVDLPAYGRSGIPASTDEHLPYTKRAMATELIGLMDKLDFQKFTVVGHDRGGRVAYRLALDHPDRVEKLAVFDVIPISEVWDHADKRFDLTYWPFVLLAQKAPLPETYLLSAPEAVFKDPFGKGSFGPEILDEYLKDYHDPARVHGICEEYRAAASLDVVHDHADREANHQILCPMLHLWAEGGPLDKFYTAEGGSLGIWRQWAPAAQGHSMKGGHFFPEENPEETGVALRKFVEG